MFFKFIDFKQTGRIVAMVVMAVNVGACSSSSDDDATVVEENAAQEENTDQMNLTDIGTSVATVNPASFVDGALVSSEIIDCTLSDGSEAKCYELVTTASAKSTDMIGPFCPTTTSSTTDEAGIWMDGETIWEADGNFFLDLPNLYGDLYPPAENWIFYDENGDLSRTTTLEGCEAAARPDVDPAYQSFCVQCSLDDLDTAVTSLTFIIPVTPTPADVIANGLAGDAGISLNGFQLAARAPVEDILSNWTIAAFDDCGGHVNPFEGYHFHAATGADGCNSAGTDANGHPELMGFALDGYGIYGGLADNDAEAASLDQCNGVEHDNFGYHYHASSPETNQHINCNYGLTVAVEGGGGGGPPDFGPTAEQVSVLSGVTVTADDIENSLGDDGPPDCDDIINAATSFGVTVEQFIEAGFPPPPGLECDFI